jgi:D-alanine-D-alanine ligase
MLLEHLIVGTELTVGMLGDKDLPVIEIIPPADGEFDYENKYNGKTQELCPPEHVSAKVQKQAQELAKKAHRFTGCRDFSRTDIMYETTTGKLYLLETNTTPYMGTGSSFIKMIAANNITFESVVDSLVQSALNR